MGVREKLGDKLIVCILSLAGVVAYIGTRSMFMHNRNPYADATFPTRSYYSDDDGATWFIDEAGKVPPFDHNGKQAFRAKLFRCGDGKPFVQRLEGYGDEAKQKINDRLKTQHLPPNAAEAMFGAEGIMVKKPGSKDWVKVEPETMHAWSEIMSAKCPDGTGTPKPITSEENVQP